MGPKAFEVVQPHFEHAVKEKKAQMRELYLEAPLPKDAVAPGNLEPFWNKILCGLKLFSGGSSKLAAALREPSLLAIIVNHR